MTVNLHPAVQTGKAFEQRTVSQAVQTGKAKTLPLALLLGTLGTASNVVAGPFEIPGFQPNQPTPITHPCPDTPNVTAFKNTLESSGITQKVLDDLNINKLATALGEYPTGIPTVYPTGLPEWSNVDANPILPVHSTNPFGQIHSLLGGGEDINLQRIALNFFASNTSLLNEFEHTFGVNPQAKEGHCKNPQEIASEAAFNVAQQLGMYDRIVLQPVPTN